MTRIQIEIFIGTVLVILTGVIILVYGLGEEERMADFERAQAAQAIEVGASLFENNCSGCHGLQGEGVPGLCPPLNDRNFFDSRLDEVQWSGTLEDYIVATVSSGRLTSTRPEQYAGQGIPAMPAWSEAYAGPLRQDQIENIATFVMNWESTAPDRQVAQAPEGPVVGTDITQELPAGDPVNGLDVSTSQGCTACHITTATGPAWEPTDSVPGIGDRAATRIEQADYTGSATTAEQYLLESIVQTNVYVVEGFVPNLMPATFGDTLSPQDAADLIAYLLTIK